MGYGVYLLILAALSTTSLANPAEDRLLNQLLHSRPHNPRTIPVSDVGQTVHVQLGLAVQKIIQVDEFNEVLRTHHWLRITWKDYRLAWNTSEFNGLSHVYLSTSDIWTPDATLHNTAKELSSGVPSQSTYVQVMANGTCNWYPRFEMSASYCPMNIAWFPFDEQLCDLVYESWKYSSLELKIVVPETPVLLTHYKRSGEWNLIEVPATETEVWYDCCDTPYSRITFTLRLRRKSLYFVMNLILPCCLFSIMSLSTFLLQPSYPERLGLGVTCVLGLSVYQIIVNNTLPTTSDAMPLLGVYFLFVMVMCCVQLASTMFVMNLHKRATGEPFLVPPPWMKRVVCKRLASLMCMKTATVTDDKDAVDTSVDSHDVIVANDTKQLDQTTAAAAAEHGVSSVERMMSSINDLLERRLRTEARLRHQTDKNQQMMSEWMIAAAVIDRICFIVFSVILVVGILVFFILFMSSP